MARMASTSSPSEEESLEDDELELVLFFFFFDFLVAFGDDDCKSEKNYSNCWPPTSDLLAFTLPPCLPLPAILSLDLSPGASGVEGEEEEAACWLVAGVPLLVLAPTLTPLGAGGGGEGVPPLLLLVFDGDKVEPLCWLLAGELLGDRDGDLLLLEVDLALEGDFAGEVFFFGTTALLGGGIWMADASAAGGAAAFLPSSMSPTFWPMKVMLEERWKQ